LARRTQLPEHRLRHEAVNDSVGDEPTGNGQHHSITVHLEQWPRRAELCHAVEVNCLNRHPVRCSKEEGEAFEPTCRIVQDFFSDNRGLATADCRDVALWADGVPVATPMVVAVRPRTNAEVVTTSPVEVVVATLMTRL
jgi:hypothetical protein